MSRRYNQSKKSMDIVSKANKGQSIWSRLEHKRNENMMRNLTSICLGKGTRAFYCCLQLPDGRVQRRCRNSLPRGEQRGDQRQKTQVGTKFPLQYKFVLQYKIPIPNTKFSLSIRIRKPLLLQGLSNTGP